MKNPGVRKGRGNRYGVPRIFVVDACVEAVESSSRLGPVLYATLFFVSSWTSRKFINGLSNNQVFCCCASRLPHKFSCFFPGKSQKMGTLKAETSESLFGITAMSWRIQQLPDRPTQVRSKNHRLDLRPALDTNSMQLRFQMTLQDEIL